MTIKIMPSHTGRDWMAEMDACRTAKDDSLGEVLRKQRRLGEIADEWREYLLNYRIRGIRGHPA